MAVPDALSDDSLDEKRPNEEDVLPTREPDDVDATLPELRPSYKALFTKFADEDEERESREEGAHDLRRLRRRKGGGRKQTSVHMRKPIASGDIRAKMRFVEKRTASGQIEKINVEELAWAVHHRLGLANNMRESYVFLDDMIQQMALIILDAPGDHTYSWYRQRAYCGALTFALNKTFDPGKAYFTSRHEWDDERECPRTVYVDDIHWLKNCLGSTLDESEGTVDSESPFDSSQEARIGDIMASGSLGRERQYIGVRPQRTVPRNRFPYRNSGFWLNRLSLGIDHTLYTTRVRETQLAEPKVSISVQLVNIALRGDYFCATLGSPWPPRLSKRAPFGYSKSPPGGKTLKENDSGQWQIMHVVDECLLRDRVIERLRTLPLEEDEKDRIYWHWLDHLIEVIIQSWERRRLSYAEKVTDATAEIVKDKAQKPWSETLANILPDLSKDCADSDLLDERIGYLYEVHLKVLFTRLGISF